MKITRTQLRQIIREEKVRILAEQGPQFDSGVAAEAMAELKAEDAFDKIQNEATTAATIMANLSSDMDIPLMDAGLHELAMDMRKAEELLDKIRDAAYNLR